MTIAADALPDDASTLKAMLIAERVQNDRLRQIIKELQRHRFGRRAETLPEDQMLLGLEDVEQDAAGDETTSSMRGKWAGSDPRFRRRLADRLARSAGLAASIFASSPAAGRSTSLSPSNILSSGK